MRLRTKIFLSIIPIVGFALMLTGWMVFTNASRSSHDAVFRYSEGILDTYVSQDMTSRVDLLKKNKLDAVQSFVDRYKREALAGADKLNLIWPGHLFVVDGKRNIVHCTSREMGDRLSEEWDSIYEKLKQNPDQQLKGHVSAIDDTAYVAQYFAPWDWYVIITIKGDFLHERDFSIWLTVMALGIVTSTIVILCLGFLLNRLVLTPVTHLREATERIAAEEVPVSIPVQVDDEFGQLSRDIEAMSHRISQSRQVLRDAYDDLSQLNEMKTRLIANVSHELRTPLTSILGFSKLGLRKIEKCRGESGGVSAEETGDAVRDALNVISEKGESMAAMIDNIILLMALMTDEAFAAKERQDIVSLVRNVCQDVREEVEKKGLDIALDLPDTAISVNLDSKMIESVMRHLISNALFFTDRGRIVVSVFAGDKDIEVSVSDTGVGMSSEDVDHVFEQFYQVGDIMTEKPKGLGVGLPICKKIIELHDGEIWVESSPGEGSSFSFSLPL